MQHVVAVVQARMGSTRLPGKVLRPLGGRAVLDWVMTRLAEAERLDQIVLATSTSPADDAIAKHAEAYGYSIFRGSEHDVLARFVGAARFSGATHVIRINADNPFLEPAFVDDLV